MVIKTVYEPPTEFNIPGLVYFPVGPVADMTPIEPAQLFDNVYYIGSIFVGALLITTPDGIVMIDSCENEKAVKTLLIPGMQKIGLDPKDITDILISHGHFDHFGGGEYLQKKYGCRIWMSKRDEAFMLEVPMMPEQFMPIGVPKVDEYLEGDSIVEIGGVPFSIYSTPGHTPGCMSFSFPVYDNGKEHTACIYGGLGMPRTIEEQRQFLTSSYDFRYTCKEIGADVELSTHPFVDYLQDKLKKQNVPGAPNPFVIGKNRVELFMDCMIASIENAIAAQE